MRGIAALIGWTDQARCRHVPDWREVARRSCAARTVCWRYVPCRRALLPRIFSERRASLARRDRLHVDGFGSFSGRGGTPRPPGAPPGAQACPRSIFRAILVAPGPPFGSPWPPLAPPLAPVFVPGAVKSGLRSAPRARCCKKEAPGSEKVAARTCKMWLKHSKYYGSRKKPLSRKFCRKRCPQTSKRVKNVLSC